MLVIKEMDGRGLGRKELDMDFTQIRDALKYEWTDQLAKDFFYEKCHGHPEDIIKELENFIDDVADATKELEVEKKLLENIPL